MRHDLPSGTVTLLFTDVAGSTQLLHAQGAESYAASLTEHRSVMRSVCGRHGGVEVDTQGDAFFVVFADAPSAVAAAREAQELLETGSLRVRMGIHTGEPLLADEGYVGADVHLAARIAAAAHGGQVVISKTTADAVSPTVTLTDLGEHRVKDFDDPVWLCQLGGGAFPPLRTISNTNLPRPASSFVGREQEVRDVVALIHDSRLVTLTGPGGSGKTRLAIEAAAELVPDFRAGVFWVGLATLRDPSFVIETIGQTLGAKDGVATYIGERELLLLLDNLEQLVDAAVDLSTLLAACPNLHVLATSRELLRIDGETGYELLPLAEREAVDLYCARSSAAETDSVRALCRALDCLPLAVELAAARATVLTADQMLGRLSNRLDLFKGRRDADARQQTLRATIEWSYELLTPAEQALFARLSVFDGGCTFEAAETVADADLDTLQALVEKSLLRHTDDRFWMLETIHEYAAERLDERGERDTLQRRAAEHMRALVETVKRTSFEQVLGPALLLQGELPNLRASATWALDSQELELALALVANGAPAWGMSGAIAEARGLLSRALDQTADLQTPDRAEALLALGGFTQMQGELEVARRMLEESRALFGRLGDAHGSIRALLLWSELIAADGRIEDARAAVTEARLLAVESASEPSLAQAYFAAAGIESHAGDQHRAETLLEDGLAVYRRLGAPRRVWLHQLINVGWYALQRGDLDRARAALEEYLGEEVLRSPIGMANAHGNLGLISLFEGNRMAAATHFRQALGFAHAPLAARTIAESLYGSAAVAALEGEIEKSVQLWGAADAIEGATMSEPERRLVREHLEPARNALAENARSRAWAAGQELALDGAMAEALAVCAEVISRSRP